ncbi:MAG: hypothetical protein PHR53_04000 [Bacteroidales bacterium]|nr:hypothetical protein [Bacteroidales bacterium]
MPKYDTCFFERYAKISLETLIGPKYAQLMNKDRPDLQDLKHSIGIEVTRAIREDKNVAQALVDEMKGIDTPKNRFEKPAADFLPYTFGLNKAFNVGAMEYDYWNLALPLQRMLKSKIEKVGNGFYGSFREFGLYVFSKDDMSAEEIQTAMNYTIELQQYQTLQYHFLFISQIQELSVCHLQQHTIQSFTIETDQAHQFYEKALRNN